MAVDYSFKIKPFVPFSEADLPHRSDSELMSMLVKYADYQHDGHLTVMKFTTNWRVGFGTPYDREDIERLAVGSTFAEAAKAALKSSGVI